MCRDRRGAWCSASTGRRAFLGAGSWGRGFGPEAISAVVDHLCSARGHHRIVIDPAVSNARAISAYSKVGFRPVGVMQAYERGEDGTFHDGLLMELVRLVPETSPRSSGAGEGAPDVVVRDATKDDVPRLRAWMRAFNASEGIVVDDAAHAAALERLLEDRALRHVHVIDAAGRAAGYAVVTLDYDLEHPGFDAFLTELWVSPEERGHGIARRALAEIERQARDDGVAVLHLAVRPANAAALRLYRSSGYRPWDRIVLCKRLAFA